MSRCCPWGREFILPRSWAFLTDSSGELRSYPSLLQVPSVEHGGVSHRSSRPQQVVPLGEEFPIIIEAGEEINLRSLVEPQFAHTGGSSSFSPLWRISETLPQSSHRYSYIGMVLHHSLRKSQSHSSPLCSHRVSVASCLYSLVILAPHLGQAAS